MRKMGWDKQATIQLTKAISYIRKDSPQNADKVKKEILEKISELPQSSGQYFSRRKFEQPYFNVLPNLNYAVRPNILLGLQTGFYAHFNERYSGHRKPIFVTVPLMATGRVNITNIKSNKLGISVAGGKNCFSMNTYPYDLKNGWLLNTSLFYLPNQKSILKLGTEQQKDNGYVFIVAENQFQKDETFKYRLNRLSIALSYTWVIKKF